jgi:hypothetical protein
MNALGVVVVAVAIAVNSVGNMCGADFDSGYASSPVSLYALVVGVLSNKPALVC